MDIEVSCINMNEMKKTQKTMNSGNERGIEGLLKDTDDLLLDQFAELFTKRGPRRNDNPK